MCQSVYSHKIDEWSVGCMLLEMVIGVPPFRGKSECTCQCSEVTHRNFNSDQLARIFLITGSPSNDMLKRVPCEAHIRGWPKAPRKLERTVEKMLTSDRFRLGGTCAHSVTHAEMDNAIGNWSSVIAAMLNLDPVSRWTCSQAYEVLTRMVAADTRFRLQSPQQCESMANINASPTSAPGGPQAASPSFEVSRVNGSGFDVPDIEIGLSSCEGDNTSPLVMRSPERNLPGDNISLFYRQCNDSKHTRLAEEGKGKKTGCGTGLVTGRAHEQTLSLRRGSQEMQRPRIDDGAAKAPTRPLPPPDRPFSAMFRTSSLSPPRSRTLYTAKDHSQAQAEMHAVGSRHSRAFPPAQSGPSRGGEPESHAGASPSVSVSFDGIEQDGVGKQRQLNHPQRIRVPSWSSMSPPRTRGQRRMESLEAQERHTSPEAHQSKSQSPSRAEGVVKRVRGTAKLQSSVEDGPIEERLGRNRFLLVRKTSSG
jgi:serine/threonine protein kinase